MSQVQFCLKKVFQEIMSEIILVQKLSVQRKVVQIKFGLKEFRISPDGQYNKGGGGKSWLEFH